MGGDIVFFHEQLTRDSLKSPREGYCMEDPAFKEWIMRVRSGEETAAAELVNRYERAVRVAVRVRLTDPRLRRQFDSMDVCQSVLASFFVRAAAGQYDLNNPSQLVGLLVKMAQNKLMSQARKHFQLRRDVTREQNSGNDDGLVEDRGPGPERFASSKELLSVLLKRLTSEDRNLALQRANGYSWSEIAEQFGGNPEALRMRLSRAIDRIAPDIGLLEGELPDEKP
jgi:RNA polymerase sigma factor (sigma-70 family)